MICDKCKYNNKCSMQDDYIEYCNNNKYKIKAFDECADFTELNPQVYIKFER